MSIVEFPGPLKIDPRTTPDRRQTPRGDERRVQLIRRRGTIVQGRALETLGHAVEYLVDTRMFHIEAFNADNEKEAVQILMRCSREVFSECPEVITLRKRVQRWWAKRVGGKIADDGSADEMQDEGLIGWSNDGIESEA
jgi:hypothetical protein